MKLTLCQINAFTQRFNGGNPAGVCPLSQWLADEQLQAIAKENGYSETAFFVARGDDYELRWFTPGCEVDLCGHATLATAHWLANEQGSEAQHFRFHTLSGLIEVFKKGDLLTLDMPANTLQPADCPPEVSAQLSSAASECWLANDYLIILNDEESVATFEPDFGLFQQIAQRGVILSAPSQREGVDFVYRWFGGQGTGIDEDPATGSAQCTLIPYWQERLNKHELHSEQLSERVGEFVSSQQGDRIICSGYAITYLRGEIELPE